MHELQRQILKNCLLARLDAKTHSRVQAPANLMDKETIKIFTKEEEEAYKKLSQIQDSISNGILELEKIKSSLNEEVEKRVLAEEKAVKEIVERSSEAIQLALSNYQKLDSIYKLVVEGMNNVEKLGNAMERAVNVFDEKHVRLTKHYENSLEEIKQVNKKQLQKAKELEEKEKGLNAYNKHLMKLAARVDSKVEALKAIK